MHKLMDLIGRVWSRLLPEVKVSLYYAGASGINLLAEVLTEGAVIDWNTVVRTYIANVLLVFIKEIKPRIENMRK